MFTLHLILKDLRIIEDWVITVFLFKLLIEKFYDLSDMWTNQVKKLMAMKLKMQTEMWLQDVLVS